MKRSNGVLMKLTRIKKIKRLLGKNTIALFYRSLWFLSDKAFVKLIYKLRMGKKLNLENPQTFTEKLQWLKLYDHNPQYTQMADKLQMREYVKKRLGEGHTVNVLGVYDSWKQIDFDKLPNSFVIKTSHDSGSYVICKDKAKLSPKDKKEAKKKITRSLRRNYYKTTREWQYKNLKPQIIIEEYLDDGQNNLTDYKFFCFNGKCEFLYIMEEASSVPTQVILDTNFNRMPFRMDDDPSDTMPSKPACLEKMISYAQELSQKIPFLRVDMYLVNDKIYIGELTFYHYGGYIPFNPPEWDLKLGKKINLGLVEK